ncbi:MAG: hypothetical protein PBU97_15610 [Stenotrophomonas maltophilia]
MGLHFQTLAADDRPGFQADEAGLEQWLSCAAIGCVQQIGKAKQAGRHAAGIEQEADLAGSWHGRN